MSNHRARDQFTAELLSYRSALHSYALSLTRKHDTAEDLVQETILRAVRNWQQYRPKTNMKAWLFTILKNECFTEFRKSQRTIFMDPEECTALADATREVTIGQYDAVDIETIMSRIRREVPKEQLSALLLVANGLRYREVAELEDVPDGTVKSRVNRGRGVCRRIREEME